MAYELYLFDADDTLFDFLKGEKEAFYELMHEHAGDQPLDEMFEHYKKISRKLWAGVEKKQVHLEYLKVERFRRLLYKFKVKKADPKILSEKYLDNLSQKCFLVDGAEETCRELKKHGRVGIVTNGVEHVQRRRLALSQIKPHVDFMIVSSECGFAKPDPRIFSYTLERSGHSNKKTVLMVGDRLEADVAGANDFGITSCWYNPSKAVRKSKIHPHMEIHSLKDLLNIKPQIS